MNSKTIGIFVALCIGCSVRQARTVFPDVSAEVARADRLWQERGVHGLHTLVDALEFDEPERGAHPDVLWRKVRALTAQGQGSSSPEEALEYYAAARETGLSCLEGAPSFRLRKEEWGWVDAIQFIPPRRAACAATLGVAWVRWLGEMGPVAASTDLEVLDALVTWSEGQPQAVAMAYGVWGRALLSAMRSVEDGRDLEAARRGFEMAMENPMLPEALLEADQVRWACPEVTDVHCQAVRERLESREPESGDERAARASALAYASQSGSEEP